jgi:putative ABC transport system substrate-binding protein
VRRREVIALLGSAAALWPCALRAQQKAMPVIGYLSSGSPGPNVPSAAFRQGLNETGYVEGQNLAIEYRLAEGHYDRLPALAADLVGRKVDLIMAFGGPPTLAAKSATSTIPVVFTIGTDPVEQGVVASFARPGGNLTGIAFLVVELAAKRFELLAELVPQAQAIALLVNPDSEGAERQMRDLQQAARAKARQLTILRATSPDEIEAAFTHLHAGALIVAADPLFLIRREQIVALASRYAIPSIYVWPEFTRSGGLISYGPSPAFISRQAGVYVGKILSGAKPADLPVEQPTRFEMVINMKAAKALGLTVPQSLLARADEVIE